MTAHVYSPQLLLMSMKTYKAMPKEDQELVIKTAREMGKFQRKLSRDIEETMIQDMIKQGVVVTRDVDRESFKKAMAPVYEQFASQYPKADIDAIMNAK
jgi:TRAP-type C4-dicarboxylate transport system substrate-binding protein